MPGETTTLADLAKDGIVDGFARLRAARKALLWRRVRSAMILGGILIVVVVVVLEICKIPF